MTRARLTLFLVKFLWAIGFRPAARRIASDEAWRLAGAAGTVVSFIGKPPERKSK